jgi:hypothetical protein
LGEEEGGGRAASRLLEIGGVFTSPLSIDANVTKTLIVSKTDKIKNQTFEINVRRSRNMKRRNHALLIAIKKQERERDGAARKKKVHGENKAPSVK